MAGHREGHARDEICDPGSEKCVTCPSPSGRPVCLPAVVLGGGDRLGEAGPARDAKLRKPPDCYHQMVVRRVCRPRNGGWASVVSDVQRWQIGVLCCLGCRSGQEECLDCWWGSIGDWLEKGFPNGLRSGSNTVGALEQLGVVLREQALRAGALV